MASGIKQEEIDVQCGRALMRIWKVVHSPRPEKLAPLEIVTQIAQAIHGLPQEILNQIGAEVKRRSL
jgi:hypothetical protein